MALQLSAGSADGPQSALCLGVNTAVDVTIKLATPAADDDATGVAGVFEPGSMHWGQTRYSAGGKATNVAVALADTLSHDSHSVLLAGIVAGDSGLHFRSLLPPRVNLIPLATNDMSYTRRCYILVHRDGKKPQNTHSIINDYGQPLPDDANVMNQIFRGLDASLPHIKHISVSGSLYPGMPASWYGQLLPRLLASCTDTTLICDFWGESALALSSSTRCRTNTAILKINRREFESTFVCDGTTDQILSTISRHGFFDWAMITEGPEKALLVQPSTCLAVVYTLPEITEINSSGSGDCVVAGMINGMIHGRSVPDSFKLGLAYGVANATTVGCCEGLSLRDIGHYYDQITTKIIRPNAQS